MLDDAQRVECQALVFNKLLVGAIFGSLVYVAFKAAEQSGFSISRSKRKKSDDL